MAPAADAVRAQLDRILNSSEFAGQERLKRFLSFVVEETLAGREEELKEIVIGIAAYSKGEAYDPRLDSTVRVEAVKLRNRIGRYYENSGRDDPVVISMPKGAYIPVWKVRDTAGAANPTSTRRTRWGWAAAISAGIVGVVIFIIGPTIVGYSRTSVPVSTQRDSVRITSDHGISIHPAISPNGELIAYASDRRGAGNLDLWIQSVSGGSAIRLTDWPGDEVMPNISPDGSRIVFRHVTEKGDALYTIPVLGKDAKLVNPSGSNPRFSPDGRHISFETPRPRSIASNLDSSRIYILQEGGQPSQLCGEFTAAHNPVWLPDGQHILFLGLMRKDMDTAPDLDWWVTPIEKCKPVRTGFAAMMRSRDKANVKPAPAWSDQLGIAPLYWHEGSIIFTMPAGDVQQTWSVKLSPQTFHVEEAPVQLTFGTGDVGKPCQGPNGMMALTDSTSNIDIFSLPVDGETGKVTGSLQRLTTNLQQDLWSSTSRNGQWLAYWSNRERPGDVWLKNLSTGVEKPLTSGPREEYWPEISPDASWVSFHLERSGESGKFDAYRVLADGTPAGKLCELCSFMGETLDGSYRIYRKLIGSRPLVAWSRASGQEQVLVAPPYGSAIAVLSPDDKWLVFGDLSRQRRSRLYLIPFRPDRITPESEWVPLTNADQHALTPVFSPLGKAVYFQLVENSEVTIVARRVNLGKPLGELVRVLHLSEAARSFANMGNAYRGLGVGRGRIVFPVRQTTSNIWLLR